MGRIMWNYEMVKEFAESEGFVLLSEEYINARSPLKFKCSKGHIFEMRFCSFYKKPVCKSCSGLKYDLNFVKDYIESVGYTLLSDKYVNGKSNLHLKCEKGHEFYMNFNNFKYGQRCPKCAGVEKYTYSEVSDYIKNIGYTLLSKEYKNNASNLEIRCDKGHIYTSTFANIKSGSRCPKCYGVNWTYGEVKEYIESFGYELLSNEYTTAKDKLKLKCENGHEFEMSFSKFKYGQRCKKCQDILVGLRFKHSYEYVKEYIESHGYKLLSKEYKSNKIKLNLECDKGHRFNMTFDNFKSGNRCTMCYELKRGESMRHSYEYVKEYIESHDCTLVSEFYNRNSEKLEIKCKKGHTFYMTFGKFQQGQRCPKCGNNFKGENKISEYMKSNNIYHIPQYRFKDCKSKHTLSFDFYLPEYNTCIEYDGVQHFESVDYFGGLDGFISTKIRDTIKNVYCNKSGIKLIRIPYWDLNNIESILNEEFKFLNIS